MNSIKSIIIKKNKFRIIFFRIIAVLFILNIFFLKFVYSIKKENINELNVEYFAKKVALDIENYNISEKKISELLNDSFFSEIALQTDNVNIYTSLIDADSGIIYYHPQKRLELTNSILLKHNLPDAWLILNRTLGSCLDSYGYYDWIEEDGTKSRKFMYLTCVKKTTKDNKRLIVGATSYFNSSSSREYIFNYFHKNLVLVAPEYPPYTSNLLPEKGFFTELTKEAFKRQNYNIDVKIMSWTEAYNSAKNGLYDGIIHFGYTEEMENYFAYSDEMPPTEFVFCTLPNYNISEFTGLESLKNFKIGSVKDYGYPEEFKKANLTKIESVFDFENIDKLLKGEVDLIIIDKAQFQYYKNNFYSNSKIYCLSPSLKSIPAHVIITKKLPNYLKIIYDFNEGLKKIKYDGTYDKILKKNNMNFYIKSEKKLKSASEKDYVPLAIVLNESGNLTPSGFSVELLKEVLNSQGYEASFYIDDWNNIKNDLINKKIDVLPLVAITPEREAFFDFSVPYLTLRGAVFVRDSDITTYEKLKNKKIIVMKGDNAEEYILRKNLTNQIITTNTYEEAFNLLSKGNYDAIVVQEIVGNSIIKKLNLTNIEKAFLLLDYKQDFSFAVSKGNKELLNILNEGLSKKIADGTYDKLYEKYFKNDLQIITRDENPKKIDIFTFIIVLIIILFFVILLISLINPKFFIYFVFLLALILIIFLIINTFYQTKKIEKLAIDFNQKELQSIANLNKHHIEHIFKNYNLFLESLTTQENLSDEELRKIREKDFFIHSLFLTNDTYNITFLNKTDSFFVISKKFKEQNLIAFIDKSLFYSLKENLTNLSEMVFYDLDLLTNNISNNESLIENGEVYFKKTDDLKKDFNLNNNEFIGTYKYIDYLKLGFFIKVDKKIILKDINKTTTLLWLNTILLILSIIFLAFILNFFITKELKTRIKEKTIELEKLNQELETKILERTKQLNALNKNLENEINKRTIELQNKVYELEKTKKAIINLLNDFDDNNKELIKAKIRLNETIEKLKLMDKKKDEFLSITAHELKTPLTSIKGFVELLKNPKIQKNKKLREQYFNIITQDTERLGKLITDILDLSRLDLGTMKFYFEKTSAQEILNQVFNLCDMQIKKKGLKSFYVIKNKIPLFYTDKSRLIQVISNLVNNSIKYTEKGHIKVETFFDKKNKYIHFRVIDTGLGIPENEHKNLFQRFYQIDSSYTRKVGGSGLGLSICKGIVEALNGKIWFNSKVGKGTTFEFKIKLIKKIPKIIEQNK
ncbi:MAG: transporter substrate-binding domain-containing protein, partial [Candidatus Woesearchaeota archaeon]